MKTRIMFIGAIVFGLAATAYLGLNRPVQARSSIEPTFEFGDSCKNVKFGYRNGRDQDIQITKVKYFNKQETRWQTESLSYNSCPTGHNCYTGGDDLRDSEGDDITKIVFEYKIKSGNNWQGSYESQEFHPGSTGCRAGKTYGSGNSWIIQGGGGSNNSSGGSSDGGGDTCKNVGFKFTNGRDDDISVTKVKYYNRNSKNWRTKDLPLQFTIHPGETYQTIDTYVVVDTRAGSNLPDANGDDLTKIIFVYQYIPRTRGGKWSSQIESKTFEPSSPKCVENKVYGAGQNWTIGGTKTPSTPNSVVPGNRGVRPRHD